MEQNYTKSLFRNRTFVLLLFAGFFTIASYSMFITTTTWYVVTDLGSASNLGVILIAATLPRLIMMVFGGVLADTFKKNNGYVLDQSSTSHYSSNYLLFCCL
ncbi:MFS transporter [Geomicrobium sp. JCM 19055]|uniref:MFS transporter n=1 Tax=Geomicrobium sp. JCM 19055 TaxID=1460649 RepID=UPI002235EA2C|nr:MFS transporter [Geomicrobium sp. JCM 19055]